MSEKKYDYYVKSTDFFNDKILLRTFNYFNYSYPLHEHDFYEINIVIKGTGIHTFKGKEVNVKAGDVFVIPPYHPHSYQNIHNLTVYHLVASRELIMEKYDEGKKVQGFLHFMEVEPYLRSVDNTDSFLHLSPVRLRKITEDLQFERKYHDSLNVETSPRIKHFFFEILYRFSGYLYEQIKSGTEAKNKYSDSIITALEYIHQNFEKNHSDRNPV